MGSRVLAMSLGALVAACSSDDETGGHMHFDAGVEEDAGPFTGPATLSATGLYDDLAAGTLAADVIPYRVRYELWSDGADKSRFLSLPGTDAIDDADPDAWQFPVGTRVWKEFVVGGVRVETRYMEKTGPSAADWLRVAYVWRADGSDADATPDGLPDARGTPHDVPSSGQCRQCHLGGADNLLGVGAYQLGAPDGDGTLDDLVADGRFTVPPAGPYVVPGEPAIRDTLGYLHANCGHCHNAVHPLSRFRTLRFFLPVGLTRPEDAPVYATAIGAASGHDLGGTDTEIVAGDPDASQVVYRMSSRNPEHQMPPLGTEVVDDTGLGLVRAWIAGL